MNGSDVKKNFFSFRLKSCPQCGGIPTIERKDKWGMFVCPEGASPCRDSPVMILFDPAQARAAVQWWNTRAEEVRLRRLEAFAEVCKNNGEGSLQLRARIALGEDLTVQGDNSVSSH